ncbi:MAG: hypothetical protein LBD03_07935 [Methanobrevibacter sp.]|nr:hypothetical protein [Candidatus Methanovirga procula]
MYFFSKNICSRNFGECLGFCLFILGILLLLFMLLFGLSATLWDDAFFSIYRINDFSFLNLLNPTMVIDGFTFCDTHHPLYYLLLKIWLEFFRIFTHNVVFSILWLKLFSLIPIILLYIFGFVRIRKDFGWLSFGIFSFCITTMPKLIFYATDIRMYSWAMFFITLSFYYGYLIIREFNKKNWIIFTLFNLFAVYTHYYCVIFVGFLYLLILAYLILKNKLLLRNWILSVVIMVLFYVPWIVLLIYRSTMFSTSNDQLWVRPGFQTVSQLFSFIFSPIKLDYSGIQLTGEYYGLTILSLLLFTSIIFSLLIYCHDRHYIFRIRKTEKGFNSFLIEGGVFLLLISMFFVLLFSFFVKPIFTFRYVTPLLGCFWLSFSVLLAKLYLKKLVFTPTIVIILLVGLTNTITFVDFENYRGIASFEFNSYTNQINENDMIIFVGQPCWRGYGFEIYFPNNLMIVWNNKSSIIKNISAGLRNGKIWIFDMGDYLYDFNNLLLENDLRLVEVGEIDPSFNYPHRVYLIEN